MPEFSFDDDYVARLRRADRDTVSHFYHYFGPLLHVKLRGQSVGRGIGSPLVQEILIRALEEIEAGKVLDSASLGEYVNSVANDVIREAHVQKLGALMKEQSANDEGAGRDSQNRVLPSIAIVWTPDVLTPSEYSELVEALAVIARAKGAYGITRVAGESVGITAASPVLV